MSKIDYLTPFVLLESLGGDRGQLFSREDIVFLTKPESHSSDEQGARHQRHGTPLQQTLARSPATHPYFKELHLEPCTNVELRPLLMSEDGSW